MSSENIKQSVKSHETIVPEIDSVELDGAQVEKQRDRTTKKEQKGRSDEEKVQVTKEALNHASELAEEADKKKVEKSEKTIEHKNSGAPKKEQLNKSYRSQMKNVQSELGTSSRVFSRLIHNHVIESVSEKMGSTIARPNALLFGSIAAFIAVLVSFLIAKYYGFRLSGFETIGTFAIGWLLGLLYDYFLSYIHRNRNR